MSLFQQLSRQLRSADDRREEIIKKSREILREAKRIIFLCHDEEITAAQAAMKKLATILTREERMLRKSLPGSKRPFPLEAEGAWVAAQEEFCEAWFLCQVLSQQALSLPHGISPRPDTIAGALSDVTGELTRQAVLRATNKDKAAVVRLRTISSEIVKQLLGMHLTGQNRMKFDSAKRNLKRIEEILYELTLRQS